MASKLITFIILSLAVSCGQIEDKLAELQTRRHPMLSLYSDFSVQDVAVELSKSLNDALMITSDPAGQEWLDFMSGAQEVNPDISARGDVDFDETRLGQEAVAVVEKYYPPFDAEHENQRNVQWEKEGGYLTMLPYCLNAFRELARRHFIYQLHKLSKQASNEQKAIQYPNVAMQAFQSALRAKLQEYIEHYKQEEDSVEKRGEDLYIVNPWVTKTMDDADARISSSFKNLHETLYEAYHQLLGLQMSIGYYLKAETDYLWTYALIAQPEEADELAKRLADLTKKQIVMTKAGRNALTLDKIASSVAGLYSQNNKLPSGPDFQSTVGPKVYAAILKLLNDEISSAASFNAAKVMVRSHFPTYNTVAANAVRKITLVQPFTGNDEDAELAAFQAFDILYESQGESSEEEIKWWSQAVRHAAAIIAIPAASRQVLHLSKIMFKNQFGGASNPTLYATIYKYALNLARKNPAAITKDNLAQSMDAEVEANPKTDDYLLLKIAIPNIIANGGFPITVGGMEQSAIDKAAAFMGTDDGKHYFTAFRQAHGLLFSNDAKAMKADLKTKIIAITGKTLVGKGFTIMTWNKQIV